MVKKDDVFELDDKLYVVLDEINYNGHKYCCCNIMENERTFGAHFAVFEVFDDGLEQVFDDDFLNNELSPIFSNNINMSVQFDDEDNNNPEDNN